MLEMFLFFYIICVLCINHKHFMIIVILMEFLMLVVFFKMYLMIGVLGVSKSILIYFMIISVCEAVMFLSILVLFLRVEGSDYFESINLKKW